MLLNLNPGAWDHQYAWLEHAKWEGGTFIDLVAPVFLFCIGVALPLSFRRRMAEGTTRGDLIRHVVMRAALLVAIGMFLNAYPKFDFAHLRIPGVLQRIGLTYGIVGCWVIATARGANVVNVRATVWAIVVILASYFILLRFVPVPGYGAPRFDPIGSWPAVVDRAVFTPAHLFPWWPVDGKVVFDPEGILSTWPACVNILIGAIVGAWHLGAPPRRVVPPMAIGIVLMAVSVALHPLCPVIKNLWTPTFALFTCGFGLATLAILTAVEASSFATTVLVPARIFGSNALLAYMISFLLAPLLDAALVPGPARSIRHGLYLLFGSEAWPNLASLLAGLVLTSVILAPLIVCYRRRWYLRL